MCTDSRELHGGSTRRRTSVRREREQARERGEREIKVEKRDACMHANYVNAEMVAFFL